MVTEEYLQLKWQPMEATGDAAQQNGHQMLLKLVSSTLNVRPSSWFALNQSVCLSQTVCLNMNVCECSELFEKVRQDADQLRAVRLIASEPVVVLSGKGGCGKTEVVSTVISYAISKINSEKYATCIILLLINIVHNFVAVTFFGCFV